MLNSIASYIPILIFFLQPMLDYKIEISMIISMIIFIFCVAKNKKIVVDKIFILMIFYITIHSIINIVFNNNTFLLFMKQFIGICINYLLYKNIYINFKSSKLMHMYINIVFIVASIGIIQQIGFIIGIKQLYDLSWLIKGQLIGTSSLGLIRITSIMIEPSQLAMVMTPAVYIAISSLYNRKYKIMNKYKSFLIIVCYILTFSSIAYIGLAIIFILNIKNIKSYVRKLSIITTLMVSILILYNNVEDFKMRLDDTAGVIFGENIENSNLSTYTLVTNFQVAIESCKNTTMVGSGIGSHMLNYEKYIYDILGMSLIENKLNVEDANSLFSRLLSELGILGVLLFILFIIKNNVPELDIDKNIFSKAIITLFILRLVRSGHYFNDGFFFFIVIFIKNRYEYIKEIKFISKNNINIEEI